MNATSQYCLLSPCTAFPWSLYHFAYCDSNKVDLSTIYTRGQQTMGWWPDLASCLFCMAHRVTMVEKKSKEDFMMWKLSEIQISVSLSKVLLEHGHTFIYIFSCGCSLLQLQRLILVTDCMTHKASNIYFMGLDGNFTDPWSKCFF